MHAAPLSSKYTHFMVQEIFEQPAALQALLGPGTLTSPDFEVLEGLSTDATQAQSLRDVYLVGWGASRHAAITARYAFEDLAHLPTLVEHAGEFRHRKPLAGRASLAVFISQSGETPDTVACAKRATQDGAFTVAITNEKDSSIRSAAGQVLFTRAGREVSVAATKSFSSQAATLYMMALRLAALRGTLSHGEMERRCINLSALPQQLDAALHNLSWVEQAKSVAPRLAERQTMLVLGRGGHYGIALEAALKFKEAAYLHAEGYPAGELKHGPNALVSEGYPAIVFAARDDQDAGAVARYRKTLDTLVELRSRKAFVLAVALEDDTEVAALADVVFPVPPTCEYALPLMEIVPAQLLAYFVAVERGLNPDKPRGLAKFVAEE